MSSVSDEYRSLIKIFLAGDLTIPEFSTKFLSKFKNKMRNIPNDEFEVLDEIFAYIDSYTTNFELLRDNPKFYLDEAQLKGKLHGSCDPSCVRFTSVLVGYMRVSSADDCQSVALQRDALLAAGRKTSSTPRRPPRRPTWTIRSIVLAA